MQGCRADTVKAKSKHHIPSSERGVALVLACFFCSSFFILALASYITVCNRTLEMSSRNLNGGHSIELAEMGMEEALWALNNSATDNWSNWSFAGSTATRTLSGASFNYDNGVTGSVSLSVTNYNVGTGAHVITATATTTMADGSRISRSLSSVASPAALFTNALGATGTSTTTGTITFNSGGTVDSYDSSAGLYSAQTPTYSAILAAGGTSTTTYPIQLTNARIKGYTATVTGSKGLGYTVGGSARVIGPSTTVNVSGTTIDASRVISTPISYQQNFAIKTISGVGTTIPGNNTGGTIGTVGATTPSIYYYTGGLELTGGTTITVQGPVIMVITGYFHMGVDGSTSSIQVLSTGSLQVYTTSDLAIYGGGINNLTQDPKKVVIYGTNTGGITDMSSDPDMSTSTDFYGVIYTPNGKFTVKKNNAIYGSIVAATVLFTSSAPVIHYDLNLRKVLFDGITTPFGVSSWTETTNGG